MEKIKINFSVSEPTVEGTNYNNSKSFKRFLDVAKKRLSITVTFKNDSERRPYVTISVWKDNELTETRLYLNRGLLKLVFDVLEGKPYSLQGIDVNDIPTMNSNVSDFGFYIYQKHKEEMRRIIRNNNKSSNGRYYFDAYHWIHNTKSKINYNFEITEEVERYLNGK
ncbi:hypothetical protein D0T51_12165 [Parabacteroides sp. 52]|uniref:hypothetical protein n=1 Tax=unclassified Parabacteroides TaxID=2649774 RepID=UPI0013D4FDA9|nr:MULTISPECIES: hypothetical protein [unclassified Parabacteroides]MDH6535629.1 hypothetical protein [Parabacteroides sp. PM5-20]NDV56473.1 hypothetical protein [Parabacteroides sp. 52]